VSVARRFFTHFYLYFISELIVQFSGVISLPIFTRVFTTAEYGELHIILTVLQLSITLAALGLRPSLFRFHGEFKKESDDKATKLFSTLFVTTLISSISTTAVVTISAMVLSKYFNFAISIVDIISFSAALIVIRTVTQLIQSHFRILDRPHYFAIVNISIKYIPLGIALFMILYLKLGLIGLYLAYLLGEGSICFFLVLIYRANMGKSLYSFSRPIFRETFKYGFPLLIQNFARQIMVQGNKLIIAPLLGTSNVGLFSLGYSVCSYIETFVTTPLQMALIPICMNMWAEKGRKETEEFLSNYLRYFFLLSFPIVFGLTAIGRTLIYVLATTKFIESAEIIPYIIIGVLLNGGDFVFFSGLYLSKNTLKITKIACFVAVFYLLANFILIPLFGLLGAAWATLLTYILSPTLGYINSSKYIKIKFPIKSMARYLVFSVVMFLIVKSIPNFHHVTYMVLLVKILVGMSVYGVLVFVFDKHIRRIVIDICTKGLSTLMDNIKR